MSRSGRVVGASDLLVVSERVDIDRLDVDVVSGVSVTFAGPSAQLPRTLLANVIQHSQLTRKYQVHILQTLVTFLPREAMLSAVYAVVVCLSVCVSVTLRYCIKTAKRGITQTTPHDSPMTLVF